MPANSNFPRENGPAPPHLHLACARCQMNDAQALAELKQQLMAEMDLKVQAAVAAAAAIQAAAANQAQHAQPPKRLRKELQSLLKDCSKPNGRVRLNVTQSVCVLSFQI